MHCEGCGRGGGIAVLAAAGAAVAVVMEFMTEILIAAGAVVGLALAVAVWVLVRMKRRGQLSLLPDGAWQPDAVRPVSLPAPITARPARALPAPQTVLNFYGISEAQLGVLREALGLEDDAGVAALRQAGYRAFDQREGR